MNQATLIMDCNFIAEVEAIEMIGHLSQNEYAASLCPSVSMHLSSLCFLGSALRIVIMQNRDLMTRTVFGFGSY